MSAIDEECSRPDVDGELVLTGEVMIQTAEQQFLETRLTIVLGFDGRRDGRVLVWCHELSSHAQSQAIMGRTVHGNKPLRHRRGRANSRSCESKVIELLPWNSSNAFRTSAKGAALTSSSDWRWPFALHRECTFSIIPLIRRTTVPSLRSWETVALSRMQPWRCSRRRSLRSTCGPIEANIL